MQDEPEPLTQFGKNLVKAEKAARIKAKDVAKQLNTENSVYSRYKRQRVLPAGDTIIAMAVIFKCSVERLLENVSPAYTSVIKTTGLPSPANGKIAAPTESKGGQANGRTAGDSRKVIDLRSEIRRQIDDAERRAAQLYACIQHLSEDAIKFGIPEESELAGDTPPARHQKPRKARR